MPRPCYQLTNPPSDDSLTVMEAGNALEPVVLRAMERAGWKVDPADTQEPRQALVSIGPRMNVTGHHDATGSMPLPATEEMGEEESEVSMFLFDDEVSARHYSDEMVVEVKTRGPEAYKRWRTLGAERSHPESVAQAGFYTVGAFGLIREIVIATMDTGSRTWDFEVVPAKRVLRAMQDACEWLGRLEAHYIKNGADPDALPARDFPAGSWQCGSCPFLDICLPGAAEVDAADEIEEEHVSDEEARDAVAAYEEAKGAVKEPEKTKRGALDTLKAWMRRRGDTKATIGGRKVSLVTSKRYSVNYRKLNEALDPETRAEIVTENQSEYVRIS